MVASVAILVLSQAQIDGQGAVERLERFVGDLGIKRKVVLTHLRLGEGKPWGHPGKLWGIGMRGDDGYYLTAQMTLKGKVVYFSSGGIRSAGTRMPRASAEILARTLIKKIRDARPARFDALGEGADRYGANFDLLASGRRFFNINPRYGYYFSMHGVTGEVIWFGREDIPPNVEAGAPKIPEHEARRILHNYAAENVDSDPAAASLHRTFAGSKHELRPELGYFKLKNEFRARLVWQGNVVMVVGKQTHDLGSLKPFVDARTGKLVYSDDPMTRR